MVAILMIKLSIQFSIHYLHQGNRKASSDNLSLGVLINNVIPVYRPGHIPIQIFNHCMSHMTICFAPNFSVKDYSFFLLSYYPDINIMNLIMKYNKFEIIPGMFFKRVKAKQTFQCSYRFLVFRFLNFNIRYDISSVRYDLFNA